ncbi:MAG TPA: glycosyltransferase family 9 protein [Candidatus Syntrophosphaera sp.]|nr:glycosyltransferase family 9 protein [Candidatus Syntrophosphaera sp.]
MRILVIRLSSIGDIILTQSVVADLRDLFPEAEIYFLCKPEYQALPELFGLDLKIIPYSRSFSWHIGLLKQSFDLVIDLHNKFSTWMIRHLVRSHKKAVYHKQHKLRRRIVKGDHSISIESTVRLYYSALETLFPDKFNSTSPIRYPVLYPELITSKMEITSRIYPERKLVALFPGAAHNTKIWQIENWEKLIEDCHNEYEFRIYGNQSDYELTRNLGADYNDIKNLCGKLNLQQLTAELNVCDAIISGDTGPMHLAAALNKPQIAIFGGTHPRLGFAPLNDKAIILSADLECQPCSLHGKKKCPKGTFECMKLITPEMVETKLKELLEHI